MDLLGKVFEEWEGVGIGDGLGVEYSEIRARPDSSSWLVSQMQG